MSALVLSNIELQKEFFECINVLKIYFSFLI